MRSSIRVTILTALAISSIAACNSDVGSPPSRADNQPHAKPTFSFRGYDEYSDCADVVQAEQSAGSKVTGHEPRDWISSTGHITAMKAELYGVEMDAEVRCELDGDVARVIYWRDSDSDENADRWFSSISVGLAQEFGDVEVENQPSGISRTFRTDSAQLYLAHSFPSESVPQHVVFMTVDLYLN